MTQTLPHSHVLSLAEIEKGYWWFMGRVRWATRLVEAAAKRRDVPLKYYADLGCGVGGFAMKLHETFKFERVFLVDKGQDENYHVSLPSAVSFNAIDLQRNWNLPAKPQIISCMDVLEHLENDEEFLKNVFDQLEPKGIFVLTVPNHPLFFSYWDEALGHHRRYTASELKKKLEAAGFKIRELSPMWSFLTPTLLMRKFQDRTAIPDEAVFPKVPGWFNGLLLFVSDLEWKLRKLVPFGTSLIACCEKP